MRIRSAILIPILLATTAALAGDPRPHTHPATGLTVRGFYERLERREDPSIVHLRDVDDPPEPQAVTVAGLNGYAVTAPGRESGREVIETMVVLDGGTSPDLPDDSRLPVIIMWRPSTSTGDWRSTVDRVLGGMTIRR